MVLALIRAGAGLTSVDNNQSAAEALRSIKGYLLSKSENELIYLVKKFI